jgi:hypothetical protein
MAVTAKSIADALDVVVEGATCKTIPLKRDDGAPRSLQKLVESKLRVVIFIMPAQETREIAVLWKQQAFKDRWVWITDNKILQIDVDSDTPKVRLPAPLVILPGWRNLPPHVCLEPRRVVTCHRQSQQEKRSMGGYTYLHSILTRQESAVLSATFVS